jgi:hypothetical protein
MQVDTSSFRALVERVTALENAHEEFEHRAISVSEIAFLAGRESITGQPDPRLRQLAKRASAAAGRRGHLRSVDESTP